MKLWRAVRRALREDKEAKRLEQIKRNIFDDPLSVDLIRKIAEEYNYHFQIIRPDGTVIKFAKKKSDDDEPEYTGAW